jgi:hypothetical protein
VGQTANIEELAIAQMQKHLAELAEGLRKDKQNWEEAPVSRQNAPGVREREIRAAKLLLKEIDVVNGFQPGKQLTPRDRDALLEAVQYLKPAQKPLFDASPELRQSVEYNSYLRTVDRTIKAGLDRLEQIASTQRLGEDEAFAQEQRKDTRRQTTRRRMLQGLLGGGAAAGIIAFARHCENQDIGVQFNLNEAIRRRNAGMPELEGESWRIYQEISQLHANNMDVRIPEAIRKERTAHPDDVAQAAGLALADALAKRQMTAVEVILEGLPPASRHMRFVTGPGGERKTLPELARDGWSQDFPNKSGFSIPPSWKAAERVKDIMRSLPGAEKEREGRDF